MGVSDKLNPQCDKLREPQIKDFMIFKDREPKKFLSLEDDSLRKYWKRINHVCKLVKRHDKVIICPYFVFQSLMKDKKRKEAIMKLIENNYSFQPYM